MSEGEGHRKREKEKERESENLKQVPGSVWNPACGSVPQPWDHDLRQNPESELN